MTPSRISRGSRKMDYVKGLITSSGAVNRSPGPKGVGEGRKKAAVVSRRQALGSQGAGLFRYTSFSGAAGTLLGSPNYPDPGGATADRLLSFTVLNGQSLFAAGEPPFPSVV